MINFFKLNKIILQTFFLILFLNVDKARSLEKIYESDSISNYFSGIISLNDKEYKKSYVFLKNLENLENDHNNYSKIYLSSLINNQKINDAYRYSKNLRKKGLNSFQSDLIIITKNIKNKNYKLALDLLKQIKSKDAKLPLQNLLTDVMYNWTLIEQSKLSYDKAANLFDDLNPRFQNIKKIENVFLGCYFDHPNVEKNFENLIQGDSADFSRYSYFYVKYLLNVNLEKKAVKILNNALEKSPRNLILNQLKQDTSKKDLQNFKTNFNCKNISHLIAELFYISANALSTQSLFSLSNYYINLAKHLNPNFFSYDSLLAENYLISKNFTKAKEVYTGMNKIGEIYKWHSNKQISIILEKENVGNKKKSISLVRSTYNNLSKPNLYQTFDYANFLRNNELFEDSINYYSKIIIKINESHELYPKATDGRGIAYEKIGNWKKAERDFLDSLRVKPNQAYVINYLAYTWIEQGIKLDESLKMLKQADQLMKDDGYITDSLGWAFFKLRKYEEAKAYLQKAVQLMPSDPIINDHYGDSLWMNGKKIQARYYWKYVLKLKKTEENLKKNILKKINSGLKNNF